jgi:mycofactocin precursor
VLEALRHRDPAGTPARHPRRHHTILYQRDPAAAPAERTGRSHRTEAGGGTECHLASRLPEAPGGEEDAVEENEQLVEETLVEEVSIDGMCGVY